MKRFISGMVLAAFFTLTAAAQTNTVSGYLVDKMCASSMVKKSPAEAMQKAAKHTRECAMEKECAAAGYGVVTDGKWVQFDTKGNEQAADFLKHSKQKDHLLVEVNGTMQGDVLAVSSIKEAKAAKKAAKKAGT